MSLSFIFFFFFFNDTATTEIYTLSLHDALPILKLPAMRPDKMLSEAPPSREAVTTSLTWLDSVDVKIDRKSTRLNSSHSQISYAVFCLKKKKKKKYEMCLY